MKNGRPLFAVVAGAALLGAPAVVLRPEPVGPADVAAAEASCGAALSAKAERKALNFAVRRWYLAEEERIGQLALAWKLEGKGAVERARLAHDLRKSARLTARRKMRSLRQVAALCERDRAVYGDPTGPSFEWAVQHAMREQGLAAPTDAAYEAVIRGAQRSNPIATAAMSVGAIYELAWNGFSTEPR